MAWKFFTANGAEKRVPASSSVPFFLGFPQASQSIPNATDTAIQFGSVLYDTDNLTVTANKITIQHAGKYLFSGGAVFDANATGNRYIYVRKQGSTQVYGWQSRSTVSASATEGVSTSIVIDCAVGDVFEFVVAQFSGGALNINTAANVRQQLSVVKVDSAVVQYVGVPGSLIGQELAYAEQTADVTSTQTVEASATSVVSAPAVTFDGATPVCIEFSTAYITNSLAGNITYVTLFDGATPIGILGSSHPGGAGYRTGPVFGRRRITPSAGAHTYSVRTFVGAGTGTVSGGAAGAGNFVPSTIRITRAA